ncbi:hypothetical protein [Streptosporangium sp. NPDC003464]
MRYRVLAVLLLLTAAVVATPGTACACSCAPLEPQRQVEESAAVFTGTVVAARRLKGDPSGPTPPIVYTFRADQVYKGRADAEFQVATNADEAACGYRFTTGSRYLVFASAGESGLFAIDPGVPLHTSLCAGNRMVRPGVAPLRADDGAQSGAPLTAGLLTALGTATPPASSAPSAAPPAPSTSGDGPGPSWIHGGVALAALGLAAAGWRLLRRGRAV